MFSLQAGTLHLTGGRILGYGGFTSASSTTVNLDGGQLWALSTTSGLADINGVLN